MTYSEKIKYLQAKNVFFFMDKNSLESLSTANNIFIEGQYTQYFKNNINYHSIRDPIKEAKRLLPTILTENSEDIILISAGLGYILPLLWKEKK